MKVSKSTIKKRQYWYYSDIIYVNRGVTRSVSRSLGRVDSTSKEKLERKKFEVQHEIASLEANERTYYWVDKIINRFFSSVIIGSMEQLRAALYRAKNDLAPIANSALETAFLVDFIYNSNRIEGSHMPRTEVQKILESEKYKNNEVVNTLKARLFIDDSFTYSLSGILKLQKILLAHEPSKTGFRSTDNMIVGNEPINCKSKEIRPRLRALLNWYSENKYQLYPPELAFEFYRRFELIHPFPDGNGRTGRLLMNKILKDARYHPIIIWSKHDVSHKAAFSSSNENPLKFMNFMYSQYKKTHDVYLKKIDPAINYAKQVEFFLSPSE